jgi:hypothetical protein
MAKLLADEHFESEACNRFRRLGHDVRTVRQLNKDKSGDGWDDATVLAAAIKEHCCLLTNNVKDFLALHKSTPWHYEIVACNALADLIAKAKQIDEVIREIIREVPR